MRRGRKKGGTKAATDPPKAPTKINGSTVTTRPIELKNTNWRKA